MFYLQQFIFDEETTDSSSSEGDGPTTVPETPESPKTMDAETKAVEEAGGGEHLDGSDTTEQLDEELPGQEEERNDKRDVVDRYAEGGDYWKFYGLSIYSSPSAWEEREREWTEQNKKPL
jgi:hypothetical protein